jgi:diguanylate cyclase (GGDEF)-like protein
MLFSLQTSSPETPQRMILLENLMVVAVLAVTAGMWSYSIEDPLLLHLFYVPVVITGFCLGSYRARLMALLCILSGCIIFLPKMGTSVTEIPMHNVFVFLLWAVVLSLIAVVVGRLSDYWHEALASLQLAHKKDVLTDVLTGVANRRAYEFELTRRISQRERDGSPLTLLLLDIDFFKKFNDRYGHAAGDAVLQKVAQIMQGTIRKADLVARIGGEEFAVILPGISFEEAQDVAERIRRLIEAQRVNYDSLILRVTVSVGFAQLLPAEDASSLIKRTDAALYSSKEAGRNCVHYHDGLGCRQLGFETHKPIDSSITSENSFYIDNELYCDETTGLPTQRVLEEELRRRTAERNRYGIETVVAVVNVDEYEAASNSPSRKQTSLMATIARMIGSELRETDLIVRFGAGSFAILMPSTTLQGAVFPLRRICTRATNYHDVQYPELSYSVSIGGTEVARSESSTAVIRNVKTALQSAIDAGGGCLVFHEQNVCHVPVPAVV